MHKRQKHAVGNTKAKEVMYGMRIKDSLCATYTRWFGSNGYLSVYNGITDDLIGISSLLDELSLKKAVKRAREAGYDVEILTYKDFRDERD